ncbi:MAG: transketolase [Spirochaetes bacterium]|nr:transketolase [Spirochaetota bacterium]
MASALSSGFRVEMMDILHEKQTGHWGGASSACDLVTALYFHRMNVDPKDPRAAGRDRFVLSKGHASLMLYTVLAHRGYFDTSLLGTFRSAGSTLQGHPCMHKTPGVDMSTGALGHGISIGTGMALGSRLSGLGYRTYVMVGEGCLNEGQSWEAIMCAAKYEAEGLTLMVDFNGVQLDGACADVMPIEPLADKFRAFGWNVATETYDGHDMGAIFRSFEDLDRLPAWPKAVVYRTVKGKGVSFMEGKNAWHGAPVDDESYAKARPELAAAYEAAMKGVE